MGLTKMTFRPGINKELPAYANEGGWSDGNCVRFRSGQPETIGGWVKYSPSKPSVINPPYAGNFDGICRALHPWQAVDGTKYLAVATERRLMVENGGTFFDETPIRSSGTLGSNPLTTVNLTPTVTVAHTSHGLNTGDIVIIGGSAAVGGITPNGEFVVTIIDANSYTYVYTANATSSVSGGGGASVTFKYLIPVGLQSATSGLGWGTGTWGAGTWGTQRTNVGGVLLDLRTESLDNWGDDLFFVPYQGAFYRWQKSNGTSTRSVLESEPPQIANTFLITKDRFLIALGCSDPGATTNFDPLSIKWSSQADYTTWTPSTTNTAGFFRLNSGKQIMAGRVVRDDVIVWTDQDVFIMQPEQAPLVFGFEQAGANCGIIGPNAVAVANGVAYWMGDHQFYLFQGGAPVPIPCTVLRDVFGDINVSQSRKFWAGVNSSYNEIWFGYCSAGATECDRVAAYNLVDGTWMQHRVPRTAWIDKALVPNPVAASTNGFLYLHEVGETDDGAPIGDFLVSGQLDIANGDSLMYATRYVPEFAFANPAGYVNVTLTFQPWSQSDAAHQLVKGPYAVHSTTPNIDLKARGRRMVKRIDGQGYKWEYGASEIDVKTDGVTR